MTCNTYFDGIKYGTFTKKLIISGEYTDTVNIYILFAKAEELFITPDTININLTTKTDTLIRITISNNGINTADYQLTTPICTWLTADKMSGSIGGGGTDTIALTINGQSLNTDIHRALISVSSVSSTAYAVVICSISASEELDTTYLPPANTTWFEVDIQSADTLTGRVTTDANSATYGDTITITATPAHGYEFSNWSDGDSNLVRQIVVTSDTTITAIFSTSSKIGMTERQLVRISTGYRRITIENARTPIRIFDPMGHCIGIITDANKRKLNVIEIRKGGIYIVHTGKTSQLVFVR